LTVIIPASPAPNVLAPITPAVSQGEGVGNRQRNVSSLGAGRTGIGAADQTGDFPNTVNQRIAGVYHYVACLPGSFSIGADHALIDDCNIIGNG
jgi:hypothetical protein